MSEPAFTPGPWKITDNTDLNIDSTPLYWIEVTEADGDTLSIAEVRNGHSENTPVTLANAHLVAAAPDLYALLEWTSADLRRLAKAGEYDEGRDMYWGVAVQLVETADEIDAALAKARGEGEE